RVTPRPVPGRCCDTCAPSLSQSRLVVSDTDGLPALTGGFVDGVADGHRLVGVVDRGMRLDVVIDALNEVGDLRDERVMGDVAAVGLDGRELPVPERAGIMLGGVDSVVLQRTLGPE